MQFNWSDPSLMIEVDPKPILQRHCSLVSYRDPDKAEEATHVFLGRDVDPGTTWRNLTNHNGASRMRMSFVMFCLWNQVHWRTSRSLQP